MEKVYFAAGCFWGVQQSFKELNGVTETSVGYMGGHKENPSYEEVCRDNTGHAEVVEVVYDPQKIEFTQLVKFFFENHDPTTLNRQGPDVGTQYRSAIFATQVQQIEISKQVIQGLQPKYQNPIVTEVLEAPNYYRAEEYHQDYVCKLK